MKSFVFDTNILINLDNYNPEIFPSLWENIYSMIKSGQLFSIKEVEREISKRDDRIKQKWQEIDNEYYFFKDLSEMPHSKQYWDFIPDLDEFTEFQESGENKEFWADPYLIAIGKIDNVTVVSGERARNRPARKIPYVCDKLSINCMDLDEFMIHNYWRW